MKNTKDDDSILFSLLQKGGKEAFSVIYNKYHKMLYVLAYQYLKDNMMAEDVVHNVFIKFWEFRDDLNVSVSLKNYLYTMTRNIVLNQIRNNNSAIAHNYQIAQSIGNYEDNLLDTIHEKELLTAFYQAIDQLPEQKKKICLYKMDESLSNQNIADKMGLSINTIKTHYSQSLRLLRIYLDKLLIFIICIILSN